MVFVDFPPDKLITTPDLLNLESVVEVPDRCVPDISSSGKISERMKQRFGKIQIKKL